ncbi:hypothetical protein OG2516_00200 [Oceanicola granulosus HTCC2516]|uniref:DUF177 domain-containing protein n=1 Tax=Oceanicola granulosus (strain ATCC BAA-861 / DSM 15982 / KCTC 12143 / HTCC2516) TaxID=314256 RepID=Q2CDV1_OCEGH|nr:YceD family protein [Oceanicola granulosus]EAR50877.1 hypothetical protein OG2516_00200 [Oceanicola granulosus HTCC2516]
MTARPTEPVRLADLPARRDSRIVLEPDAAGREALAAELDIPGLRKFRFEAVLHPEGRSDWRLEGTLGATAVQSCVVTLEPVATRIDETVTRRYLAALELPEGGTEVEMPEDDTAEPLPAVLDLYDVALEALALALPPYPRAPGVDPGDAVFAGPGVTPMTDDDARPFAGLAGLRDKLGKSDDDDAS